MHVGVVANGKRLLRMTWIFKVPINQHVKKLRHFRKKHNNILLIMNFNTRKCKIAAFHLDMSSHDRYCFFLEFILWHQTVDRLGVKKVRVDVTLFSPSMHTIEYHA